MCNNTDEVSRICINEECLENKEVNDNDNNPVVEIELNIGLNVNVMNTNEILHQIAEVSGIGDISGVTIGWATNEEGLIIRVIVYVENEEVAKVIAKAVNELDRGEGCEAHFGVLCKTKNVRLFVKDADEIISQASRAHILSITMLIVFLSITKVVIHL